MRFSLMKANYCSTAFILVGWSHKETSIKSTHSPVSFKNRTTRKVPTLSDGKKSLQFLPEVPLRTENNVILNIPALIQFRLYNKFFLFIFNIKSRNGKVFSSLNKLIPISELSSTPKREGHSERSIVRREKLKHTKSCIKDNDHERNLTTFCFLLVAQSWRV